MRSEERQGDEEVARNELDKVPSRAENSHVRPLGKWEEIEDFTGWLMGLKYHTIIVVPHERAKFRKWRISNRQLGFFAMAVATLTAAAIFVTWSYFTTSVSLEEIARLAEENEQLRLANDSFETSIHSLQQQLAQSEDRTNELAIVAGLQTVSDPENRTRAGSTGTGGSGLDDTLPASSYDLSQIAERVDHLTERLTEVSASFDERLRMISQTPTIMPVRGIFTSGYGYRRDPITSRRAFHNGVDISARPGKPVQATADGIVTKAGRVGSLGRAVYLAHGLGFSTRYGHLSEIAVKPGQKVRRGEIIGYVGNSGRSTGYHLHYEVRTDNKPKNPLGFILDRKRS